MCYRQSEAYGFRVHRPAHKTIPVSYRGVEAKGQSMERILIVTRQYLLQRGMKLVCRDSVFRCAPPSDNTIGSEQNRAVWLNAVYG